MKIDDIVLNESFDDVFAEVLQEPFFKNNLVNMQNVLVHYTNYEPRNGFEKRKLIPRSRPRDTARPIHDYLNYLSKEKFDLSVRTDTLFTYSVTHDNVGLVQEADYGTRYVVIPKGEYTLYHTPGVHDFTDFYKPQYCDGKFDFVVYMFRKNATNVAKAVETLIEIFHEEVDVSDEDRMTDLQIKSVVSDMTHMIDHDFTHMFKSEGLHTLEEEFKSIVEYIVTESIKDSEFEISSDARKKIMSTVYWLGHAAIENELDKYRSYIKNMKKTAEVEEHGSDEYMLFCNEFYIFDYEEFYQYLEKMS